MANFGKTDEIAGRGTRYIRNYCRTVERFTRTDDGLLPAWMRCFVQELFVRPILHSGNGRDSVLGI